MSRSSATLTHTLRIQIQDEQGIFKGGAIFELFNDCPNQGTSNGAACSVTSSEYPSGQAVSNVQVNDVLENAWSEQIQLASNTQVRNQDFAAPSFLNIAVQSQDPDFSASPALGTGIETYGDTWRCDNAPIRGGQGCVNPNFTPIMTYDALKTPKVLLVAQHISDAQQTDHRGVAGYSPLHYEPDETVADSHRNAACAAFVPASSYLSSCDEYPLASSKEGGAGASIRAVSVTSQRSQGGTTSRTYALNRMIDNDPFYVSTVLPPALTGPVSTSSGPGSVSGWGTNASGELGDGTKLPSSLPLTVPLSGVTQIESGGYSYDQYALALLGDGSVWAWGANTFGELGNGTTTGSSSPVQVPGISNATYIATGAGTAYAVLADGTIRAWGYSDCGQLGNGGSTSSCGNPNSPGCHCSTTPVQVSGITTAVSVAGGSQVAWALLADGTVRSWGYNNFGSLGDGSTTTSSIPVVVQGLSSVTQIAGNGLTGYSLNASGTVESWGYNYNNELGDGNGDIDVVYRPYAGAVTNLSGVVTVIGAGCGLAITDSGALWSWGGSNCYKSVYLGSSTPQQVAGLSDVSAAARYYAVSDDKVYKWGDGTPGCGIGGIKAPTVVSGISEATDVVSSGDTDAFVLDATVQAYTPEAPSAVTATAGNGTANVSWSAPRARNSAITSYTVTPYAGTTAKTPITVSASSRSTTVPNLTNGTSYTFAVIATNAVGNSSAGSSSAVTPSTVASVPTSVSAVSAKAGATVSWTAPSNNGGSALTSYTITPYVGSAAKTATTVNAPATSGSIGGLTAGTAYTFKVVANNAVGSSPASSATNSVTPTAATAPASPTSVSAVPGNASAAVSWVKPADTGGSVITGYAVTPYQGSTALTARTATASASSLSVTGLTNGKPYTFKVTATNAVGTSSASSASAAVTPTPPTAPAAPSGVTASQTAANTAKVSWIAPANNGSAITGYTVTPYLNSVAQTATKVGAAAVSASVTNLTAGSSYSFRVTATNSVGTSAAGTSASLSIAAPSAPSAPIAVTATITGDKGQYQTVNWSLPFDGYASTSFIIIPNLNGVQQSTYMSAAGSTSIDLALSPGTYTFVVVAANNYGSAQSSPSNSITVVSAC